VKQLRELTMKEFNDEVLNGTGETFIQVTSTTCMPCKVVEALFVNLKERKPEVNIVKVNITNSPEFIDEYSIMGTPTMLVFDNGEEVRRESGQGKSMNLLAMLS
jgi:thioredoxin 1